MPINGCPPVPPDHIEPVGDGQVLEIHVAGIGGVPMDAAGVVLDIVATESIRSGYLTVYPCGTPRPPTSNVNYTAGQTIANSVTTAIGANGKICVFVQTSAHMVVDVNGFLKIGAGYRYLPIAPARVADTRETSILPAGTVLEVAVAGVAGVPADAKAVVLNVAVTEPQAAGFLTMFPCGTDRPTASNLNYVAGQTVANSATVPVGVGGKVCIFVMSTTHVVVDVNGAYAPLGTSLQELLTPERILDTRVTGLHAIGGQVFELTVGGVAGVPEDATAALLNVTVTNAGGAGFLTVFPCGSPRQTTSNVNYTPGQTVANQVIATIGENGKVCLFAQRNIDIVVDVSGAFTAI